MNEKSTGFAGIAVAALCIGALILSKKFFPSFFSALAWIVGIAAVLIVVLIGVVLYFAFKKPKPGTEAAKKAEVGQTISEGRNRIANIRRICLGLKNVEIRNSGVIVCTAADKILGEIRQKPELAHRNRQFFSYYLPTLASIVETYQRIEKSGIPSGDMAEKVLEHLSSIKLAFDKQYESLFADDILDLSVEIEVMMMACRRDGLLAEEDFALKETEKTVSQEEQEEELPKIELSI